MARIAVAVAVGDEIAAISSKDTERKGPVTHSVVFFSIFFTDILRVLKLLSIFPKMSLAHFVICGTLSEELK
jgi:hypothetical protein